METQRQDTAPRTVEELEVRLSQPSERAVEVVRELDGHLMVLGVGGKMGPTLARMAVRAGEQAGRAWRVIGVSRFSDRSLPERLASWGVEPLTCDLLDAAAVADLPDVPNVIFMSGMKFGASRNPSLTWALNCYSPALVCRKFSASRIVAFSSGNVYGMVPATSSGSRETDPPEPVGEYSMTVLGRERIFEYFCQQQQTPTALLRLNYATEMRYGVLVDIGRQVWAGQPVDISIPAVNVIWQAEANAMALAALARTEVPARVINVAGPEIVSVRQIAERFGELFERPVRFAGKETRHAYLNDGRHGQECLGAIRVSVDQMIRWTADWVARGGASLDKPTHFQVTDGTY